MLWPGASHHDCRSRYTYPQASYCSGSGAGGGRGIMDGYTVYIHIHIYICIYPCIYIRICKCICIYIHINNSTNSYTCIHTYVYIYICMLVSHCHCSLYHLPHFEILVACLLPPLSLQAGGHSAGTGGSAESGPESFYALQGKKEKRSKPC